MPWRWNIIISTNISIGTGICHLLGGSFCRLSIKSIYHFPSGSFCRLAIKSILLQKKPWNQNIITGITRFLSGMSIWLQKLAWSQYTCMQYLSFAFVGKLLRVFCCKKCPGADYWYVSVAFFAVCLLRVFGCKKCPCLQRVHHRRLIAGPRFAFWLAGPCVQNLSIGVL